MSLIKKLLLFSIFITIAVILYFSREIFFYQYEPEYQENLYYHSQWNIPNSTRGISDGELYKFVGYAIIKKGENPFDINYEVPPFGKSLYGLAELSIGNPYWVSISLYIFSIIVVYKLLMLLTKKQNLSLCGTLLFASTPYVATQVKETMLDLPLMFFYLLQTYFFIKFISKKNIKDLIFSGIFLGLASATKLGVYTPLISLIGIVFVYLITKDKFKTLFYPISVVSGYVLGYFSYFIRHPNPIPWMRLHQKIIDFYLGGGMGKFDNFAQWKGVLTASLGDWSPMLAIGLLLTFYVLIKLPEKNKKQWMYLSLLSLAFLLVNSFIPFFSRYLMPVIPIFVLLITFAFKKAKYIIILLVLLNIPFISTSLAINNPAGHAEPLARYISTRAYRELYRSIRDTDRENIEEQFFIDTYEKFLNDLGTRFIDVEFEELNVERNSAAYKYKITYDTRYGDFVHEPTFLFEKKNDQWKLVWDWKYLWEGFEPGTSILVREKQIPLYIVEGQGGILATRAPGKEVYIIPRVMLDWAWHLGKLSELTGESTLTIDERVKRSIPDHYPRFIGYLDPRLDYQDVKDSNVPGVTFKDVNYIKISDGKLGTEGEIKDFYKFLAEDNELLDVQADIFLLDEKGQIINQIKEAGIGQNKIIKY
ncbi:MAG: glycosyltransferase family 39 protein [Patescibacteria group bacterium]